MNIDSLMTMSAEDMSRLHEEIDEEEAQVRLALFREIVSLHPTHLTLDELILRMTPLFDPLKLAAVQDALRELRRSGLVRLVDGLWVPTFAALRTAEVLEGPD